MSTPPARAGGRAAAFPSPANATAEQPLPSLLAALASVALAQPLNLHTLTPSPHLTLLSRQHEEECRVCLASVQGQSCDSTSGLKPSGRSVGCGGRAGTCAMQRCGRP